jgi:hypothetical protein
VRPYSKGQKNDFRDAEAIAEAVQRPNGYTAMSLRLHLPTSWRASPGACLLVVAPSKQASFKPRNRS